MNEVSHFGFYLRFVSSESKKTLSYLRQIIEKPFSRISKLFFFDVEKIFLQNTRIRILLLELNQLHDHNLITINNNYF